MRLFVETWYTQEIFFRKEQSPERTLRRARTNYLLIMAHQSFFCYQKSSDMMRILTYLPRHYSFHGLIYSVPFSGQTILTADHQYL